MARLTTANVVRHAARILTAIAVSACASTSLPPKRDAAIAYLAHTGDYWQVWVMAADGSSARQVTTSPGDKSRVSWFPGGKELLVSSNDGTVNRVSMAGEEVRVPLELSPVLDAVVSPGGQRIAFSFSTAIDGNDIWVSDADGGNVTKVVKMATLQHEPAWTPGGDALYFLSGGGGQAHDIWRVSLPDGSTEQITVGSLYHFDVSVSPGGELAFSSNRSGNYEIYVQGDGARAKRLTDHPALDAKPGFSPDGESLVFESTREGRPNIWRLDLSSGALTRLTNHELGARSPVWLADTVSR